MKRVGFLFEKVISEENLLRAIKNATKNKKNRRGIVLECHEHPEKFVKRIQKMLESGNFAGITALAAQYVAAVEG